MWKKNFIAFLGIWTIALAFLGFSDSLHRILLVFTGALIVILSLTLSLNEGKIPPANLDNSEKKEIFGKEQEKNNDIYIQDINKDKRQNNEDSQKV